MTLTQKETAFLQDLKGQEELCIAKYEKYRTSAHDKTLSGLFGTIKSAEESHLQTVSGILNGENPTAKTPPTAQSQSFIGEPSGCSEAEKQEDAYLCRDALSMEKHVSALYDTSIFEFTEPPLRDVLSHIQKEEQNHGEQLYQYLSLNNLYQ